MEENCFVIMAISDQNYGDVEVTSERLKDDYENVVEAAIQSARPRINVLRADECAVPGTITTNILIHLIGLTAQTPRLGGFGLAWPASI